MSCKFVNLLDVDHETICYGFIHIYGVAIAVTIVQLQNHTSLQTAVT